MFLYLLIIKFFCSKESNFHIFLWKKTKFHYFLLKIQNGFQPALHMTVFSTKTRRDENIEQA